MPTAATPTTRFADRAVLWSAGIALVFAALIALHVSPVNGPPYYPWTFARVPLGLGAALAMIVATHVAVVLVAAERLRRLWLAVALLTVASLGLRLGLAAAVSEPPGLANAAFLVRDANVGSFFTAAQMAGTVEWTLDEYPTLMPQFPLHARHKAPGPMLFWTAMLRATGGDAERASRIGVAIVGAASALAVPLAATLALAAGWGRRVARHAAAATSMLPGAILFFPLFDPAYLAWSLLMLTLWFLALGGRAWWAAAFGASLAATMFLVFNVLPIGLLMALAGIEFARRRWGERWLAVFVTRSAIAIAAAIAGLIALRVVFGYDAIATLHTALEEQADMQRTFGDKLRPYPLTIPWDLYDAAFGTGFAPAILAVAALATRGRVRAVAACGLFTAGVIAVASLLPVETARVWCFLFPAVTLPAAAIVARAGRRARVAFYVALGAVLLAMATSIAFVQVAPVITSA